MTPRPDIPLPGRKKRRQRKRQIHSLGSRSRLVMRGDMANLFLLARRKGFVLYLETLTAPPHAKYTPLSQEFEDAFVKARNMFRRRLDSLRRFRDLYRPAFDVGIMERQAGVRKLNGEVRGAPHVHYVTAYAHTGRVSLFPYMQSLRWLSCLKECGFEYLSEYGRLALERRDPAFLEALKAFNGHRYEALTCGDCIDADGVMKPLSCGEYDVFGLWHDWFLQPADFVFMNRVDGKTADRISSYMSKYFGKQNPVALAAGSIAGKVADLSKKVSKDLQYGYYGPEDDPTNQGLYGRLLFATAGLKRDGVQLGTHYVNTTPGAGFDCLTLHLEDDPVVGNVELFRKVTPAKHTLRRLAYWMMRNRPGCGFVYRLTCVRREMKLPGDSHSPPITYCELEFEPGGILDESDRNCGCVIGGWGEGADRKSVRYFLFSNPAFGDALFGDLTDPSKPLGRRLAKRAGRPFFNPETDSLYRAVVGRRRYNRKGRGEYGPYGRNFVPSPEYLDMVRL